MENEQTVTDSTLTVEQMFARIEALANPLRIEVEHPPGMQHIFTFSFTDDQLILTYKNISNGLELNQVFKGQLARLLELLLSFLGNGLSYQNIYDFLYAESDRRRTNQSVYNTIARIRKIFREMGIENIINIPTQPKGRSLRNTPTYLLRIGKQDLS